MEVQGAQALALSARRVPPTTLRGGDSGEIGGSGTLGAGLIAPTEDPR